MKYYKIINGKIKCNNHIELNKISNYITTHKMKNLTVLNEQLNKPLLTIGGSKNKTFDNKYTYNTIELDYEDDKKITLVTINDEYEDCGSFIFNISSQTASITQLTNNNKCIKCKNSLTYKVGEIIMQIMLDLCFNKYDAVHVELTDESFMMCNATKFYTLKMRTLTHGDSYYTKFGFKFKHSVEKEIFIHNKTIFKNNPILSYAQMMLVIDKVKGNENIILVKQIIELMTDEIIEVKKYVKKIVSIGLLIPQGRNDSMCRFIDRICNKLYELFKYKTYPHGFMVLTKNNYNIVFGNLLNDSKN